MPPACYPGSDTTTVGADRGDLAKRYVGVGYGSDVEAARDHATKKREEESGQLQGKGGARGSSATRGIPAPEAARRAEPLDTRRPREAAQEAVAWWPWIMSM